MAALCPAPTDTPFFDAMHSALKLHPTCRKAIRVNWPSSILKRVVRHLLPDMYRYRPTYDQNIWVLWQFAVRSGRYPWAVQDHEAIFTDRYRDGKRREAMTPMQYMGTVRQRTYEEAWEICYIRARCSVRLNDKYLAEALRLRKVYHELCRRAPPSRRFDDSDPKPLETPEVVRARKERTKALDILVKTVQQLSDRNRERYNKVY
jgi:hypothetical protein